MPKKIEEKIHILSPSRAYLAAAKVMGPIVHPLLVDKSVAVNILMSGAEVYEYLPKTKKTLKLTLGNINDPNRYNELENTKPEVNTTPVTPVMRNGVPNIVETEVISESTTIENESTEETPVEETTVVDDAPQESDSSIVFEYNEDGTVDESKIEWGSYTKNQRKEIRAQINQHNSSLTK